MIPLLGIGVKEIPKGRGAFADCHQNLFMIWKPWSPSQKWRYILEHSVWEWLGRTTLEELEIRANSDWIGTVSKGCTFLGDREVCESHPALPAPSSEPGLQQGNYCTIMIAWWGWRDGLVMDTHCFCRGLQFGSQHPHRHLITRDLMLSSGILRYLFTWDMHSHRHTQMQ